MKRNIPIAAIAIISIVSVLHLCRGRDDDFEAKAPETVQKLPIDLALQHRIDSFMATTPYVGTLAMKVYDITAGREIYSYREKELMSPASCLKLLTCITALRKLGPAFNYKTTLYTTGTIQGDTLFGDIVLKTSFDPAFNRDSLQTLLHALPRKGIKALKGRVLLDMPFLSPMNHEQHWTIGDLKTSRMGLLYHGYRRLRTETTYALRSVAGISLPPDSIRFGRLNPRKATEAGSISTPLHYATHKALKNSSNINAEGLLYPLGRTTSPKGCYRLNGINVLKDFIRNELRLDPDAVCRIDDGCGLCPDNKVTADLLVSLLVYAHQHPYIYKEVQECLPLSGTDGTLFDRLRRPNVAGKIKAKTGTLTREEGISSLSGYFTGADGHLIAFSIINNQCPVLDGRWWQDRLCAKAFLPPEKQSRQKP